MSDQLIKFYTDTETTGLSSESDQILSYSVILENHESQNFLEKEVFIKLKDNILPDPKALMITNINPFIPEYQSKAVAEIELLKDLTNISGIGRIMFIAYNAEFDEGMYGALFGMFGVDFGKVFPMIWDPLKTVKVLIKKDMLLTPEIVRGAKSYRTAKLEDVYKTLGYDSSMFNAHTALDDTKMLQSAAHGIYFMATGRELGKINPTPHLYQEEDVYSLVVDADDDGLVIKQIKVIQNNIETKTLNVVDPEGSQFFLDYHKIYDQYSPEERYKKELLGIHSNTYVFSPEYIVSKRKEHPVMNVEEMKAQLEKIEQMSSLEEKKGYADSLTIEEINKLQQFSYSHFADFALKNVLDIEHRIELKKYHIDEFIVETDPRGIFRLYRNEELLLESEKKTEIERQLRELYLQKMNALELQKLDLVNLTNPVDFYEFYIEKNAEGLFDLKEKKGKNKAIHENLDLVALEAALIPFLDKNNTAVMKEIYKKIPSIKDFKIEKHPAKLLAEFNEIKAEIFQSTNKIQKEILKECLSFYKKRYPSIFKNETLPTFQLNLNSFLKK